MSMSTDAVFVQVLFCSMLMRFHGCSLSDFFFFLEDTISLKDSETRREQSSPGKREDSPPSWLPSGQP